MVRDHLDDFLETVSLGDDGPCCQLFSHQWPGWALRRIQQQVRNAGLDEDLPKFLIHDNDGRYGQFDWPRRVVNQIRGKGHCCRSALAVWLLEVMYIRSIPIPYGAPNAQAHVERLIGTLRRECLDHMLIWNERHLHQVLSEFINWHNNGRVHQGIHGIPDPDPALAKPKPALQEGRVVAIPILGGLHHDYRLAA